MALVRNVKQEDLTGIIELGSQIFREKDEIPLLQKALPNSDELARDTFVMMLEAGTKRSQAPARQRDILGCMQLANLPRV